MKNSLVIDLGELARQQRTVNESNADESTKEGLNELFSTIRDMADSFKQDSPVTFVMVIHEERLG